MIARAVICVIAVTLGAVGASTAAQSRLDTARVATLARDEMRRLGLEEWFTARVPVFQPERRKWRVAFVKSKPPYFDNGDVLVVIDDATGSICVQQGLLRGPCG